MARSIADIRKEYTRSDLDIADVSLNPIDQFRQWFEEARLSEVAEPNAMTLSTVDSAYRPSGRIVLLKGIEDDGFSFFTNYHSQKAAEMQFQPFAALTFFWIELERQVRIRGKIVRVTSEESDAYFASRPRGSQIGAWVSEQSKHIESRAVLDQRWAELEERFRDSDVPRPEHWGGFKLLPDYIEFWQGRASRLHDRIAYNLTGDGSWEVGRLSP